MTIKQICPHCKGVGAYESPRAADFDCETCNGTGTVTPSIAKAYIERVDKEIRAFMKNPEGPK